MSGPTALELSVLYIDMANTCTYAREARALRKPRPLTYAQQSRMESLRRADAHISRCQCGTQVWDGHCGTCERFERQTTKTTKETTK